MSRGYTIGDDGFYVIDKQYLRTRLHLKTGFVKGQEGEVEALINQWKLELFNAKKRGIRPPVTFWQCCQEYVDRNASQKQIINFARTLERLSEYIGHVPAHTLHQEHPAVRKLISDLKAKGRKQRTVGAYLESIRRVLIAAESWVNPAHGLTWIEKAPKIKIPKRSDSEKPRVLSWDDQRKILGACDNHLADEILFFVNTGLRDGELNSLQWRNELIGLPEGIMAFVSRNKPTSSEPSREKLVVCNSIAREVIERKRGEHPTHVFTFRGKPKTRTNNSSFKKLRARSGVYFTVHGLRHTFAHRLRDANVTEETRSDLLGHSVSLTSEYSAASLQQLHRAVCSIESEREVATVLYLDNYRTA